MLLALCFLEGLDLLRGSVDGIAEASTEPLSKGSRQSVLYELRVDCGKPTVPNGHVVR